MNISMFSLFEPRERNKERECCVIDVAKRKWVKAMLNEMNKQKISILWMEYFVGKINRFNLLVLFLYLIICALPLLIFMHEKQI